MGYKRYIALVWRWAWLLIILTVIGGVAGLALGLQTTPVYRASTNFLISRPQDLTGTSADAYAALFDQTMAKTFGQMMRSSYTLETVIKNLHLDTTSAKLANRINVSVVRDTQIINLTVDDTNPATAAAIANEVVKVFRDQNRDLETARYTATKQTIQAELDKLQKDMADSQAAIDALRDKTDPADAAERTRLGTVLTQQRNNYATLLKSIEDIRLSETQASTNITILDPAIAPSVPILPNKTSMVLTGALIGLFLAAAFAFLNDYLDDSVKSTEQTEQILEVSSLGVVGVLGGGSPREKLVTLHDAHSPLAEAYGIIRANIEFAEVDGRFRTLMITSSSPGEGKSTTLANLAIAMAKMGENRVIVVDADLRRPTLHTYFNITNNVGLTTALLEHGELAGYLHQTDVPNLRILASGILPPNPTELLNSRSMVELIDDLKAEADVILFDSPPVLAAADAALLARICDGTVLVIKAGSTKIDALKRSHERIQQSGARLVGFVLNNVTARLNEYHYYYGGDYSRERFNRWSLRSILSGRSFRPARSGSNGQVKIGPKIPVVAEANGNGHIDPLEQANRLTNYKYAKDGTNGSGKQIAQDVHRQKES